jgi:hypothetical protein
MKKEDWVVSAPVILTVAGLDFTVHNNGQHIIVQGETGIEYHLWPSTGKWRVRHPEKLNAWGLNSEALGRRYQGVRGLVSFIQKEN